METTKTADALNAGGWRQRSLAGFIGMVGPLWTRNDAEGWSYGLLATASHLNPAGLVHGGMITTLLDHALSTIAWETAGRVACVTVQLDTQFVSAARAGQFLEARGRVVKASSSLIFMQGHVLVSGAEIATGTAILKLVKSPS
jgi:uncharacterized protein (TIGR00369 family)